MDQNNVREPLPTMDCPDTAVEQAENACETRVETRFHNLVKSAFIKSLLATVLANVPIAWFVATFLGVWGLNGLKKATRFSEDHDLKPGGLYTATQIMGYVGLILGAYNSISYIISLILSLVIIILYFLMFAGILGMTAISEMGVMYY